MPQGTNRIADRESEFIVGREREMELFRALLERRRGAGEGVGQQTILHLYGTGGVGKSTLLRQFLREAEEKGETALLLDSRDFVHTEQGLFEALLRQLQGVTPAGADPQAAALQPARMGWLAALERLQADRRLILAFDTFEEMQDIEALLRDRLLPWLTEGALVLLAGRLALGSGWMRSPAWRERVRQLPVGHLSRPDCMRYLEQCGVREEEQKERVWRQTHGHPLSLSLAAAAHALSDSWEEAAPLDWFAEVAALWLREVPDGELRKLVEAASVLRVFDQELLSSSLEAEVPAEVFDRLTGLSFVRKSERGWQLHDLMRETTEARLRERAPKLHRQIKDRIAAYYADEIIAASGRKNMDWEVGELFRHAGVEVLRALTAERSRSRYYWETVTESSLGDALAYLEGRRSSMTAIRGWETDPQTGQSFHIDYSAEAVRYNSAGLDLEEVFRLEPSSIQLLRDAEGGTQALSVNIPIHKGTLAWLTRDPFCGPYLRSLSPGELRALEAPPERPAGWFLRCSDYADLMNPAVRTEGVYLIYSYIGRGGILICSPYPTEITRKAYIGFGFSEVPQAEHRNYDGITPAPTYVLDARGAKLRSFFEGLLGKPDAAKTSAETASSAEAGGSGGEAAGPAPLWEKLTEREREVAGLVLGGCSNPEIGARLYISEVTVKKHLKSVYAKLGITKRIQLAGLLLGE
ncbi:DNA-binding CsgD family transcriptional regulator [Paenibacillus mucilaginosus]|uniref:LuxR C-terminal-related transcriptional regulator n=1 Tax=Paenibacillus mucilaginosus TaxID=61624 RepID=UPI003D222467